MYDAGHIKPAIFDRHTLPIIIVIDNIGETNIAI